MPAFCGVNVDCTGISQIERKSANPGIHVFAAPGFHAERDIRNAPAGREVSRSSR